MSPSTRFVFVLEHLQHKRGGATVVNDCSCSNDTHLSPNCTLWNIQNINSDLMLLFFSTSICLQDAILIHIKWMYRCLCCSEVENILCVTACNELLR